MSTTPLHDATQNSGRDEKCLLPSNRRYLKNVSVEYPKQKPRIRFRRSSASVETYQYLFPIFRKMRQEGFSRNLKLKRQRSLEAFAYRAFSTRRHSNRVLMLWRAGMRSSALPLGQ